MSFHEFRRQLEYKAAMRGGVVAADRWFASSKTCSCCGHKLETLPQYAVAYLDLLIEYDALKKAREADGLDAIAAMVDRLRNK